jgi:hypothetical protein
MIENEVSFTSIYTNELETIKNSEKIFKDKKNVKYSKFRYTRRKWYLYKKCLTNLTKHL